VVLSFFTLAVQEFSSSKASALGFTWEHHYRCRKGFEVRARARALAGWAPS